MRTLRNLLREITKMAKGYLSDFLLSFSKTLMEEARLPLSDSLHNRKMMLDGLGKVLFLNIRFSANYLFMKKNIFGHAFFPKYFFQIFF